MFDPETLFPVAQFGSSTSLPYYVSYGSGFAVKVYYKSREHIHEVFEEARKALASEVRLWIKVAVWKWNLLLIANIALSYNRIKRKKLSYTRPVVWSDWMESLNWLQSTYDFLVALRIVWGTSAPFQLKELKLNASTPCESSCCMLQWENGAAGEQSGKWRFFFLSPAWKGWL